jgi:hypothetical protein
LEDKRVFRQKVLTVTKIFDIFKNVVSLRL